MKPFVAIVILLVSTSAICQKAEKEELVSFIWQYNGRVLGRIKIPAGYKEEGTENYVEGIVTRIHYRDDSTIILQSGGMYSSPMLQAPEYLLDKTEVISDRKIRRGKIKNEGLFWREDKLKMGERFFPYFPPNIAFDKVPKDHVELFEKSLDSFAGTLEEK
ncbi:MAG: hypothetical protein QOC96_3470 [Acidobacteriota bacterium]|jgi:hypothetical protein|nr:hypothetical protein [Acidobacteriota bacterium]